MISDTQELSHAIAASVSHLADHNPIPKWHGLISGVAFPVAAPAVAGAMSGKLPRTITGLSPEPVVRFSYTPY